MAHRKPCEGCGKIGMFTKQENLCDFCYEVRRASRASIGSGLQASDWEEQWFDDARKQVEDDSKNE